MSTTEYVVSALTLAIALVAIVLISFFRAVRRKRARCATCNQVIPAGDAACPACSARQVPGDAGASSIDSSSPPLTTAMELSAVQGALAPKRFPVPTGGLTIGRSLENDVVLADEMMVSRCHAAIALQDGQYILQDRDSTNGVWANNRRVLRHVLSPGDRVQIGQSLFLFGQVGAGTPPPSRPAEPEPSSVQVIGDYFEGYHIERLIGRGGMSEVFKAQDPDGRTVAIKVLQETNSYIVDKFVQEGNKIGPLLRGHPNIVQVSRFDRAHSGHLYLVMEFVDAVSLRRVVRQMSNEQQIVNIVGQVCQALAFAHQNQIVHRDIKPENILVDSAGQVKVLDFGVAKLTSAATITRDRIVGTPEYLSPEQARGDPVQPASDLYSLGIVLYEMLAGTVPFPRSQADEPYKAAMSVVRQHLHDRPQPVRKHKPGVRTSSRLERVAMRALEKESKNRFKTAQEMGDALGFKVQPLVSAPLPQRPRCTLLIQQGPRQGQHIPLAAHEVTIGRADLEPDDLSISRSHARIVYRAGGYWIEDTSQNGTWVDNRRVHGETPLKRGSYIVISNNVLRLVDDSQSENT